MKALLLKDFYVLRKQMWVYAIIVLAWGVVSQAWLNLLAVVYGSMIPYSAMAYDQRSRWDKFTRMLPYSDQAVVMSRYVLGWIFILASVAIVMLSQGILSQLSIPLAFFSALPLRILFVALCIGCLLLALNIPLMLRFGAEKARLVSALTTFLVFLRRRSQRAGRRREHRSRYAGFAGAGGSCHHRHRRFHSLVPEDLS